MRNNKTKHALNPVLTDAPAKGKTAGTVERDSFVSDSRLSGGKRKGRHMKRKPIVTRTAQVTVENLRNGRDNDGYLDTTLNCVVYSRQASRSRSLKGYGIA